MQHNPRFIIETIDINKFDTCLEFIEYAILISPTKSKAMIVYHGVIRWCLEKTGTESFSGIHHYLYPLLQKIYKNDDIETSVNILQDKFLGFLAEHKEQNINFDNVEILFDYFDNLNQLDNTSLNTLAKFYIYHSMYIHNTLVDVTEAYDFVYENLVKIDKILENK